MRVSLWGAGGMLGKPLPVCIKRAAGEATQDYFLNRHLESGREPFVKLRMAVGKTEACDPPTMAGTRHVRESITLRRPAQDLQIAIVYAVRVFFTENESLGWAGTGVDVAEFEVDLRARIIARRRFSEISHLPVHRIGAQARAIIGWSSVRGTFVNSDLTPHISGHEGSSVRVLVRVDI